MAVNSQDPYKSFPDTHLFAVPLKSQGLHKNGSKISALASARVSQGTEQCTHGGVLGELLNPTHVQTSLRRGGPGWKYSYVVEYLTSMFEVLGSVPNTMRLGTFLPSCIS